MDNDDLPVGHVLTRRQALGLLGLSGAAILAAGSRALRASGPVRLPACVARPAQTLGPYFVDEKLNRSDIRSDPATGVIVAGSLLDLRFNLSRMRAGGCDPLPGAQVDVWQCDAQGVYSDVRDPGFDTSGKKFLRGYQVTDEAGLARFTTIYPGWYRGRTVHIHFKVRTTPSAPRGYEFVSQVYFDDKVTDRVFTQEPYARRGARSHRNDSDGIFGRGGEQLIVPITETPKGYGGTFDIGLQIP